MTMLTRVVPQAGWKNEYLGDTGLSLKLGGKVEF